MGDVGRVLGEWVDDVRIDGDTVAMHLPVARHGEGVPLTHIIVGKIEVARPLVWCLDPVELPGAVERLDVGRGPCLSGRLDCWEGKQCGMAGFLVATDDLRVFPVEGPQGDAGGKHRAQAEDSPKTVFMQASHFHLPFTWVFMCSRARYRTRTRNRNS